VIGTTEATPRGGLERMARGGLLNLVGAGVYGASGFVIVVLVSRGYPVESVGAFLVAIALFNVLASVARLGADVGLIRFVSTFLSVGRRQDVGPALRIGMGSVAVSATLLGLVLFAVAVPLAAPFADGPAARDLAVQFRVLALFLPVATLGAVAGAATRGLGTMAPTVAIEKVARPAVQVLGVAAAALTAAGPGWLALAWAGPFLPALVATAWWLHRHAPSPGAGGRPEPALRREFWAFSAPRALGDVCQVGLLWADTLLLGLLATTGEAGVYAAATRYLLVGQLAQLSVTDVVQPQVAAALAAGAHAEAQRLYQVGTAWLVSLTWPIYLTLAFFAPVFLGLFGPEFVAGAPALSLLCVAMLVATAAGPVDAILLMGGRSSWSTANTASALVLNIGLNLLLIPRMGMQGAAIAWAVSLVWRNAVPLVQVDRYLHLSPFGRGMRVVAPATLLVWALTALAVRQVTATLPVAVVVSVLVSAMGSWLVLWRHRVVLELPALLRAVRR
jgi:O-antigen/teichoic acid export membrane protein